MTFNWRTPLMRLSGLLLAIHVVVGILWFYCSGISLDWSGVKSIASAMLNLAAVTVVLLAIKRRLKNDDSRVGKILVTSVDRVYTGAQAGLFFIPLATSAGLLSYLVFTPALPLRDAEFAHIDAMLGFDWMGLLVWVNNQPLISGLLTNAYHSSGLQLGLAFAVLCIFGQVRKIQQLLALFSLSSCFVIVLSGLLPAEGAFLYHNPTPDQINNLTALSGRWHLEDFRALRDGTFTVFDFKSVEGLVTFPSFHTILAIIVAYVMREIQVLGWLYYVMAGIVVVSTLPEGGHYLVDIIAGAIIAVGCIAIVRRVDGQSTRVKDLFPTFSIDLGEAAGLVTSRTMAKRRVG